MRKDRHCNSFFFSVFLACDECVDFFEACSCLAFKVLDDWNHSISRYFNWSGGIGFEPYD